MSRRAVDVKVALLHILAMIAFIAGQAEQAFFQNGILTIPQSEGKTEAPLAVADTEQSVFAPAVGATARVIVRKIIPAGAPGGVVLANRPPLPLGKVRTPALPVFPALRVFVEASPLGIHQANTI